MCECCGGDCKLNNPYSHENIVGVTESLLGKQEEPINDIWDILKARGINPVKSLPMALISRLEDIGRAQQRLHMILQEEIFQHDYVLNNPEKVNKDLTVLEDNLWDLWRILRKEEEI